MEIQVDAKLILQIPEPKKEDTIPSIVLATEMFINALQGFNTSDTHTAIGVRAHIIMESCQEIPHN